MRCPFCGSRDVDPSELVEGRHWCNGCTRAFTITLEPGESLLGVVDPPSRKVTPSSGDEFR